MITYLGIDGGGTKTAFVLGDAYGNIIHEITLSGCSYLEIGEKGVLDLLQSGLNQILDQDTKCAGCCLGLPCYGENADVDERLTKQIEELFYPIPVHVVNDGVVGWAGSLACNEGIHLVAGTGSIAFGKGKDDLIVRTGGWSEFFGDEGSCYWIGKQGMSLFSKQADGRLKKGPLYSLVKEKYNLKNDFEFIDVVLEQVLPYRDKVAAFQKIVLEAALINDESCIQLYDQAAKELALMVKGIKEQLSWSKEPISVSYSGGLFFAKDLILVPLSKELERINCNLIKPLKSPKEGALLMAIQSARESI